MSSRIAGSVARAACQIALGACAIALGSCTRSPDTFGYAPIRSGRGAGGAGGPVGGIGGSQGGAPGIMVDTTPATPSAGCGIAVTQPLGTYARFAITVPGVAANATDRVYYVRLPANYDPARPYRTIYLGPGCGPIQDRNPALRKTYAMETAPGFDAILIAMEPGTYNVSDYSSTEYCFDDMVRDSVEYPYFDVMHKDVEARFCVDTQRQFFAGYSSGGWMAHQLGCAFPDVLRAQASVTGGLPPSIAANPATTTPSQRACVDHPIAAFLIHDFNDRSNVFAGSVAARDRLLIANGCAGTADMRAPYQITSVMNSNTFFCVQYSACPTKYPIVFCQSSNQMHNSQATNAVPGFWEFFSKL